MCALCRRNLLAGECYRHWRGGGGRRHERPVCGLCERDAARGGWMRVERAPRHENAVGLRGTVRLVA